MKNLMDEVIKARNMEKSWNEDILRQVVNQFLNSDSNNRVDWDEETGEEWVYFFRANEEIAILHNKFPLCFAKPSYSEFFIRYNTKFWTVLSEDFDREEWFIDINEIKNVPNITWHASEETINADEFSVYDFRFATD